MSACALIVSDHQKGSGILSERIGAAYAVDRVCQPGDVVEQLEERRYDVVLLDSRSESVSDDAFINTMRQAAPEAIPVIFDAEDENYFKVRTRVPRDGIANYVHCEEPFSDQIARECLVVRLFEDECTRRIQPLITRTPTQRGIYHRVVEEVNSPRGSLERVAEFISSDPMLTARVLQMVNSAALGMRRRFVDAHEAVLMLGGERIKSLIVFVEVFSICEKFRFIRFSPEKLWRHSLAVGRVAREIMRTQSRKSGDADAAFTGGLLHDVGKLLLAINLPDRYREVLEDVGDNPWGDVWASELKFLQTSHAEVGAMILESWNLPYPILEAVGYHHSPNRLSKEGFTPLDAVSAANVLVQDEGASDDGPLEEISPVRRKIWDHWGVDQMLEWRETLVSDT